MGLEATEISFANWEAANNTAILHYSILPNNPFFDRNANLCRTKLILESGVSSHILFWKPSSIASISCHTTGQLRGSEGERRRGSPLRNEGETPARSRERSFLLAKLCTEVLA